MMAPPAAPSRRILRYRPSAGRRQSGGTRRVAWRRSQWAGRGICRTDGALYLARPFRRQGRVMLADPRKPPVECSRRPQARSGSIRTMWFSRGRDPPRPAFRSGARPRSGRSRDRRSGAIHPWDGSGGVLVSLAFVYQGHSDCRIGLVRSVRPGLDRSARKATA